MTIEKEQNLTFQITEMNDKNNALINMLIGYCENIKEIPTKESIFDILVILEQMKKYSNDSRRVLEQLNDCF